MAVECRGALLLLKKERMRRQSLKSKKEPTEDVFFSRLFGIEKSEVRLRDKETIDFETAGTDGRNQTSDIRRQTERGHVGASSGNLQSEVFTFNVSLSLRLTSSSLTSPSLLVSRSPNSQACVIVMDAWISIEICKNMI